MNKDREQVPTYPLRANQGSQFGCQISPEGLNSSFNDSKTAAAIQVSALLSGEVSSDEEVSVRRRYPREVKRGERFLVRSSEGPTADLAMSLREHLTQ